MMPSECVTETGYYGPDQPMAWAMADGYNNSILQRSFAFYRAHSANNQAIYLAIELYLGDEHLLQRQQQIAAAIRKSLMFDHAEQNLDVSEFKEAVCNGELAITFCSRQGIKDLFDGELFSEQMSHALVSRYLGATICPAILAMIRQSYIKRPVWQEMQKFMAQYAS
jgi:hypothetical protein